MATKKNNSKKTTEKSTLIKIAETIGTVAGEIAVKKDQLVHMASDAIDSVKSKIKNIKGKKETTPAKAVVKKAAKKATLVKKAAVKKTATAKKTAAKVVKKAVKPVAKKAVKKVATVKKAVKKVAKKAQGKK